MFMIFLLLIFNTWITLNINVAIISMVRPSQNTHVYDESKPPSSVICPNMTFFWSEEKDTLVTRKSDSLVIFIL